LNGYCETIGYELTVVFIAQLGNNNFIAAYASIFDFATVIYCIDNSFAVACRTRINVLIGAKHNTIAKNFYKFSIVSVFLVGVLISIVAYFATPLLAKVYADSNEEMREEFKNMMHVYAITMSASISLNKPQALNQRKKLNLVLMLN